MSTPTTASWVIRCPVCDTPVSPAADPCRACAGCGLPAAAHAGIVVSRIGSTLIELHQERDALLDTLRAAAPRAGGPPAPGPAPAPGPDPVPGTVEPPAPRRRRLSPQGVLVGLGALLVVAAALALVAVAWTRFGLVFQSGVMATATAIAVVASGWAARGGLRATEEGLAVVASSLLVIDLAAARAFDLFGLQTVDPRWYAACSATGIAILTGVLAWRRPSTRTWFRVALVAAQPVLLLLLGELSTGPLGLAALLLIAGIDAALAGVLPRWGRRFCWVLAALQAVAATASGLRLAYEGSLRDSLLATSLFIAAAAAVVISLVRWAGQGRSLLRGSAGWAAVLPAVLPAAALAGTLQWAGFSSAPLTALLGPVLVTVAVLRWASPLVRELTGAAGLTLLLLGTAQLVEQDRPAALAAVALAVTLPAALAAWRLPTARLGGTATALLAPAAVLVFSWQGDILGTSVTGLLLALLAAAALGLATHRVGTPVELAAAAVAPVIALAAAATGASSGAWGQVGTQLAILGAAGLGYAVVSRRAVVGPIALGDLVLATWIALAGAQVQTVEAYTLPLAAALLLAAAPRLRRAPSWVGWGPGLLVGFLPSVLAGVATDDLVRVLLVIASGTAAVIAGTVTHRQAPFLIGAVSVGVLGVALIGPYAARLDSWVTLGAAGLTLLMVGATYERRRQQGTEAVAWVAQLS